MQRAWRPRRKASGGAKDGHIHVNRKLSHLGKKPASAGGNQGGGASGATTVLSPPEPVINCDEFHAVLAQVLERNDLPPAAQLHLNECGACESMIRDFETIAQRVRRLLPLEVDAVPDQWPRIRIELLREGIIHAEDCPGALAPFPKLVQNTSSPRRPR